MSKKYIIDFMEKTPFYTEYRSFEELKQRVSFNNRNSYSYHRAIFLRNLDFSMFSLITERDVVCLDRFAVNIYDFVQTGMDSVLFSDELVKQVFLLLLDSKKINYKINNNDDNVLNYFNEDFKYKIAISGSLFSTFAPLKIKNSLVTLYLKYGFLNVESYYQIFQNCPSGINYHNFNEAISVGVFDMEFDASKEEINILNSIVRELYNVRIYNKLESNNVFKFANSIFSYLTDLNKNILLTIIIQTLITNQDGFVEFKEFITKNNLNQEEILNSCSALEPFSREKFNIIFDSIIDEKTYKAVIFCSTLKNSYIFDFNNITQIQFLEEDLVENVCDIYSRKIIAHLLKDDLDFFDSYNTNECIIINEDKISTLFKIIVNNLDKEKEFIDTEGIIYKKLLNLFKDNIDNGVYKTTLYNEILNNSKNKEFVKELISFNL